MTHADALDITASLSGKRWRRRAPNSPSALVPLTDDLDDLTRQIFLARGADPDDFARLVAPTLRDWLPDPSIFLDMDKAAARLAQAMNAGEKIVIFGDYDVDGATSTALLIRFLRACGHENVDFYIPDRLREGYGPSATAMETLAAGGAQLIITVDCGTQAFDALAHARDLGCDVIVVDHHKASAALPDCLALVNPNRVDESDQARAYGHLAAVGVAFLLAVALNRLLRAAGRFTTRPEPDLLGLLDLVALGTVADVAPLTGLNRAFVAQGVRIFARRQNIGLIALTDAARLDRPVGAGDLGFLLGPRINAGGRVGRSDLGTRLLITQNADEAAALAAELDDLNRERQTIEALVTEQALEDARHSKDDVIVVAGHGWHAGVIGIVAARLKERLDRPAIVISLDDMGKGKGSGRSLSGVDLGAAILAAKDHGLLVDGGGHAMAAGLTIDAAQIDAFRQFLCDRLHTPIAHARAEAALAIDFALPPQALCLELAEDLEKAGPYGVGWPRPCVAIGPCAVVKADRVGENHVRLVLAGRDGGRVKAVAFRQADTPLGQALLQSDGRNLYVAGHVKRDDWRTPPGAELHVMDAAWA